MAASSVSTVVAGQLSTGNQTIYVRLWALASGSVSHGSSVPIAILPCGAGETVEHSIAPAPVVETSLSAQVVQATGFAASGTAVTWAVTVTIFTHD